MPSASHRSQRARKNPTARSTSTLGRRGSRSASPGAWSARPGTPLGTGTLADRGVCRSRKRPLAASTWSGAGALRRGECGVAQNQRERQRRHRVSPPSASGWRAARPAGCRRHGATWSSMLTSALRTVCFDARHSTSSAKNGWARVAVSQAATEATRGSIPALVDQYEFLAHLAEACEGGVPDVRAGGGDTLVQLGPGEAVARHCRSRWRSRGRCGA